MSNRALVSYDAPTKALPDEWLEELRAAVARRGDIAAVYWVKANYVVGEGRHAAEHELHFELARAGEQRGDDELRDELGWVLPVASYPYGKLVWSIAGEDDVSAIKRAGLRIA